MYKSTHTFSTSAHVTLPPRESSCDTQSTKLCVGLRAGLDVMAKEEKIMSLMGIRLHRPDLSPVFHNHGSARNRGIHIQQFLNAIQNLSRNIAEKSGNWQYWSYSFVLPTASSFSGLYNVFMNRGSTGYENYFGGSQMTERLTQAIWLTELCLSARQLQFRYVCCLFLGTNFSLKQ
jgi:hypothetical protein